MKIVLSGVETNNKGAELMLYAILQEIERRWPDAEVFIPFYCVRQGLDYLHTNLNLRYTPFSKLIFKLRINAILRILHIPYGWLYYVTRVKDADWFLDGSGYGFSDLWNIKDGRVNAWETMLKDLHQHNCKIVFLPQAFGPVEQENTKRMLRLCNDYASLVIPREQVSYGHIVKSGVLNLDKVKVFTDFTSLVEGVFPRGYERLKNGICIIPNRQMILKGATTYDNYFQFLTGIIGKANNSGYPVYLLNHEGPKDAALALQCKERIGDGVEVVTGLN
ncbi:MAG: polysaccharide pyruvyl transferase family protein, partial [Aeriscardovia sp.]|nr:polysaccharide pyruvyl transferase family protein [Aeriscardovia sp.]